MLFLAHILNRPVFDSAGLRLGWVEDLVLTGLDLFPRVEAVVLARRGHGAVFIPWEVVREFGPASVRLSCSREHLPTSPLDNEAVFLRRDILDKQVVDIHGRKVVRVNDLQLAPIDHELRLIGADIGMGGLLRRLNLEAPARTLARSFRSRVPERVIPWNYVEGLETEWPSVRLNVSHRRLRDLPANDIAEILTQLQPDDRDVWVTHIDDETLADALPHMEEEIQADVIEAMPDERASDIMEILPPDEAADVLGDLSGERAERILYLMEPDEAEDVRELLRYADDTAGGRMTTEFIALAEGLSVAEALAELRELAPDAETVYYVYVTDAQERLEGVLSLRDLITATDDTPLTEIVHRDVIRVKVDDDQEEVARTLNHYHLLAVPVVDVDGVLHGIVTVDDVLDVLHEEAEEDRSLLAGIVVEESDTQATPWALTSVRLPWLLGAGLVGMVMASYLALHLLQPGRLTLLLALLPLVLLLGVQLGGQGAATTQVALSEGETLREVLLRLLRNPGPAGVALSLLAAMVGGVLVAVLGTYSHGLAVAGVIWGILLVEMLAGSLLPILLHRLRWDPVLVNRPALAVLALLLGVPLLAQVL